MTHDLKVNLYVPVLLQYILQLLHLKMYRKEHYVKHNDAQLSHGESPSVIKWPLLAQHTFSRCLRSDDNSV